MTYIDTNLTFSTQTCDFAIGGIAGLVASTGYLFYIALLGMGFYLIYKIAETIKHFKKDTKKEQNKQ